jgi:Ca2+-binding RTX toxin-like protein
VEKLVLQGAGSLTGIGNELDNKLFGNSGDNTLDGGVGADRLTGNAGNDTFVFHVGQADGDIVVDFAGNGSGAGDSLQFVGYGQDATFRRCVGLNSHEIITFLSGAAIHQTDYFFM